MPRLCLFCSSALGVRPAYAEAARTLGRLLAERGIGIVYGGAHVGMMGAVADAALAAGGEVIGVIPRTLMEREVGHTGLTALHVVETMHERKKLMADLSDGFVALPGGIGTYEELFEVWTWGQLGIHAKPVALLDVDGFYAPLAQFLDHVVTEGFLRPEVRGLVLHETEPAALLARLGAWIAPDMPRVLAPDER